MESSNPHFNYIISLLEGLEPHERIKMRIKLNELILLDEKVTESILNRIASTIEESAGEPFNPNWKSVE